jgi:pimeloyl-ACP methyl ester carboxylesterase
MSTVQPPVIVVPGITATSLEDVYPVDPEEIWTAILKKEYERISLHPDNVRYEAREPARVLPRTLFGIVYEDLILALRHDLSAHADRPTPVFAFPYDWRQDCRRSAEQLGAFVEEVLDRTRLVQHYQGSKVERVDLVGHSIGGLVIGGFLSGPSAKGRVRRVVTIGTPFRGAIDAVLKIATGMGTLTGENPRDREREAARTIPAIYQLLPSFKEAVIAPDGFSKDLFDARTWQASVLDTLREYVRLHGARIEAETLFGNYLQAAREFRRVLDDPRLPDVLQEGKDGWLPIVGLNSPTQVEVRIVGARDKPRFQFIESQDDYESRGVNTGDGTVPFLGACPSFLERERLACVIPDDFSFWEFKDRTLAKAAGFHGALPTVNLVQRLVLHFLRDDYRGDVWARPAPQVERTRWPRWLEPPGK